VRFRSAEGKAEVQDGVRRNDGAEEGLEALVVFERQGARARETIVRGSLASP
jgi:hypothetical protein